MRAVRFHAFGGPEVLRIEDLPLPEIGPDDVLIRVAAAGVNYADLMRRAGTYQADLPLPYTLGVEAAGTVERVGEKVTGLEPGDRVATFIGQKCQAERVAVPAGTVYRLPAGLPLEEAGGLPLAGFTAYHLLRTRGGLRPGESVLIQAAASGVGTFAVQMARAWGARCSRRPPPTTSSSSRARSARPRRSTTRGRTSPASRWRGRRGAGWTWSWSASAARSSRRASTASRPVGAW